MQETDLEGITRGYLAAFEARDMPGCMSYYADDATLNWAVGVYKGKQAIEEWHEDRFAADLKITRLDGINVQANTVVVDVVATSKRLSAWRLHSLSGRITFEFENGKIKDTKFSVKVTNPLENWT